MRRSVGASAVRDTKSIKSLCCCAPNCCATIWMRTTAIEFEAAAGSAGMIVSIIEVRKLFLLPLDCR